MESKQELDAKLTLYKNQLDQVNDLLLVDSENPQFLKLREDLGNVIALTNNLVDQVYAPQDTNTGNDDERSDNSDDDDDGEKFSIKKQSKSILAKSGAITVGENVEVTGGDRLFAGTVVEVINDTEYKIKYFEFDNVVSLPASSLLRIDINNPRIQQLEAYEVSVGLQCQSKYAMDLQYYDCVVTGITKNGYNITYSAYGNVEEVPLEYLRETPRVVAPLPSSAWSGGGAASSGKKDSKGKNSDGLIPIPEALKILPTDTEEEKNRKKKKIKAIKNKNRIATIDNEVTAVQTTWQNFVTKGSKRSLSGLAKSSQFASTSSLDGKLGIANSGKGMTTFGERKKHKFDL